MNAIDTLKECAARKGIPITHIGTEMGKRPNYISVAANKGTQPGVALYATMLGVCGYGLFAIPCDDIDQLPDSALQIQGIEKEDDSGKA